MERAAQAAGQPVERWRRWEVGIQPCPARDLAAIAGALGAPIASLLVDELVLAEVRISEETLARVKREGRPAAAEVAVAIAGNLEALLVAEASREPVDLAPYARARPRRTREQVLAGKRPQGAAH